MGDGAIPPATQPNLGRDRERLFKAAAILFGLVLAVMLVEISARIVSRRWFSSFLEREVDLMKRAYPVSYDPELGWVPRAGFSGNRNVGKTQVTINTNGLRANGGSGVPPSGSPVLAVGDSFTFGDGVSDGDTWPARLEKNTRASGAQCGRVWLRRGPDGPARAQIESAGATRLGGGEFHPR
jgi:hypothetical protein